MKKIETFILNAKKLDAKDILLEAASLVEAELADQNIANRHLGLLASGKDIHPNYATAEYETFKKSIGSISGSKPDLHVEGDFDEGSYAKVKGGQIMFGSTDEKAKKLAGQYGYDLFGVQNKDLVETTDPQIPRIIDKKLMA